jgi:hypothetical protein
LQRGKTPSRIIDHHCTGACTLQFGVAAQCRSDACQFEKHDPPSCARRCGQRSASHSQWLPGVALPGAGRAETASTDPRDIALLSRMTLAEKTNQLMLLSKGTMTGPDSAGRPNKSAEELAREGIGFQMSAFTWSTADANRIQRIAVKESRLGIPVVFATDIIHGYWTVFPVPLGLAASFDPADARTVAAISASRAIRTGSAGRLPPWSITRWIHVGVAWSRRLASPRS